MKNLVRPLKIAFDLKYLFSHVGDDDL